MFVAPAIDVGKVPGNGKAARNSPFQLVITWLQELFLWFTDQARALITRDGIAWEVRGLFQMGCIAVFKSDTYYTCTESKSP